METLSRLHHAIDLSPRPHPFRIDGAGVAFSACTPDAAAGGTPAAGVDRQRDEQGRVGFAYRSPVYPGPGGSDHRTAQGGVARRAAGEVAPERRGSSGRRLVKQIFGEHASESGTNSQDTALETLVSGHLLNQRFQRMGERISERGTDSRYAAFETWLSEQPWNRGSRGSGSVSQKKGQILSVRHLRRG